MLNGSLNQFLGLPSVLVSHLTIVALDSDNRHGGVPWVETFLSSVSGCSVASPNSVLHSARRTQNTIRGVLRWRIWYRCRKAIHSFIPDQTERISSMMKRLA
jgi:hypothetical protein